MQFLMLGLIKLLIKLLFWTSVIEGSLLTVSWLVWITGKSVYMLLIQNSIRYAAQLHSLLSAELIW